METGPTGPLGRQPRPGVHSQSWSGRDPRWYDRPGLDTMQFESPGVRVGGWVPEPRPGVARHAASRHAGTVEAAGTQEIETGEFAEPYLPPEPAPTEQVAWLDREPATHGTTVERWIDRALPGLRRRPRNAAAVIAVSIALGSLLYLVSGPTQHRAATPAATARPSAAPVAFTPITVEAEAPGNTLTGSAFINTYAGASGGQVVRAIGNWGNAKGPGALRVNDIVVPATGQYALTFAYVNIKADPTRSVVITASAGSSMTVTVANNGTCCTSQLVEVFLFKGPNSITFSNPTGQAPAIDKITIDQR